MRIFDRGNVVGEMCVTEECPSCGSRESRYAEDDIMQCEYCPAIFPRQYL